MAAIIIQPEQHKRFPAFTIPSDIVVDVGEDGGVMLDIEATQGEVITGAPRPDRDERGTLLERGESIERCLLPDEARALAAALWHQADAAERPR